MKELFDTTRQETQKAKEHLDYNLSTQIHYENQRNLLTQEARRKRTKLRKIEQELEQLTKTTNEYNKLLSKIKRDADKAYLDYEPLRENQLQIESKLQDAIKNLRYAEISFQSAGGRLNSEDEKQPVSGLRS